MFWKKTVLRIHFYRVIFYWKFFVTKKNIFAFKKNGINNSQLGHPYIITFNVYLFFSKSYDSLEELFFFNVDIFRTKSVSNSKGSNEILNSLQMWIKRYWTFVPVVRSHVRTGYMVSMKPQKLCLFNILQHPFRVSRSFHEADTKRRSFSYKYFQQFSESK